MNNICDLYLVVPCSFTEDSNLNINDDQTYTEIQRDIKDRYREIAEIVLADQFVNRISRKYLNVDHQRMIFKAQNSNGKESEEINYSMSCVIQSQWMPSHAREGAIKNFFCTVTLAFNDVDAKDIISILNSITLDRLAIHTNGATKNFDEWLSGFKLKKTAAIKTAVFFSSKPRTDDLCFMLATEVSRSVDLTSTYIKKRSLTNIAQYSSAKIYASDAVVLEIPKIFKQPFKERLFGELATIFVIELHVQHIAFLGYFESKLDEISNSASEKSLPSIIELNNLVISAMDLWRTSTFRFILARNFYEEIGKAFKVEQNFRQINDGKALLEQLVHILKLTSDEKENRKLNNLLLFLAVMEVFPFLTSVVGSIIQNQITAGDLVIASVSVALTAIFYWLYKSLNK